MKGVRFWRISVKMNILMDLTREVMGLGNNSTKLLAVWDKYVEEKKDIVADVSPMILESWKRSIDLQVDPYHIGRNDILEHSGLRHLRERNRDLLEAAREAMEDLFVFLKGNGITVVLTDMQGYIMEAFTEDSFFHHAQKVALAPGANWSETIKGTNAIGTALIEAKSVHVKAKEHFCQENHILACSATPIFDGNQQIIGILDITGDYRIVNDRMFAMLRMAAKNIENRLVLNRVQRELAFSRQEKAGILELMEQSLISFDTEGKVTDINASGAKALGLRREQCIGHSLNELLGVNKTWLMASDQSTGNFTIKTADGTGLVKAQAKKLYANDGSVQGVLAAFKKAEPNRVLADGLTARYCFDDIITGCPNFRAVIDKCRRVAQGNTPVLLLGETGTGKEVLAQSLHQASTRCAGPFVVVNCAALPAELIESELFGYDEGAFTGSRKGGYPGKFELAHGGTIFLDEIGELPLLAQAKLLRVLQERQVMRLGATKIVPVDIRVIAATNQDLASMVEQGQFRRDLFYRLNVVTVNIPPLRERTDDLLLLVQHFLAKHTRQAGKGSMTCSPGCISKLKTYPWPGNVRELENTLEGLVNLVEESVITSEHLPVHIRKTTTVLPENSIGSMRDAEQNAIYQSLMANKGNISRTAKMLGIGRTTLYRKVKEYGFEIPR